MFQCINDAVKDLQLFDVVLAKVKKVVQKIRKSSNLKILLSQMQQLEKLPQKALERGIEVRWNSLYTMFKCFLDNKKAIKACQGEVDFGENELTRIEWELLEECVVSLEGFYSTTLLLQRRDATISLVIPIVKAITLDLETKKKEGKGNFLFITALLDAIEARFSSILYKRYTYMHFSFLLVRYKCFLESLYWQH